MIYHKWLNDFMEPGRGAREDGVRKATWEEVLQPREENERLKQVAEEWIGARLQLA